ncbi:MAG: hypothetical protein FGM52_04030, partial [Mycobacterium sp.]|nr:hypothetical protein [Mycobacterium sp.]
MSSELPPGRRDRIAIGSRIGALTVTFGIGAWLVTGTAWADTTDAGSTGRSAEQSAAADSNKGSAGPARRPSRTSTPVRGAARTSTEDQAGSVPVTRNPSPGPAAAERPAGKYGPASDNTASKPANQIAAQQIPLSELETAARRIQPAASVRQALAALPAPSAPAKQASASTTDGPVSVPTIAPAVLPAGPTTPEHPDSGAGHPHGQNTMSRE